MSQRVNKISGHLMVCPVSGVAASSNPHTPHDATASGAGSYNVPGAVDPPVVRDPEERMAKDPIQFLIEMGREHPGCFMLERKPTHKFVVISDVTMFEDVLTFDQDFGNPVTPNMSVNKNVFKIPVAQLEKYEQTAIGELRKFILTNNNLLADEIAEIFLKRITDSLGESGTMDLREFGTNIFWPMTEALFGKGASKEEAPYLKECFDDIDSNFGLALKGKVVPKVVAGVDKAYTTFAKMLEESKKQGGCPMGQVPQLYDRVTEYTDPNLTAKLSTAAWWGGQGNTLPSTVWTFGMILADPRVKKLAYDEVDKGSFKVEPTQDGHFNYDTIPYLTAALKETLRMKTYSIAWRLVQRDCSLYSKAANKTFRFKKGDLIGLHFAMRHMDEQVHDSPYEFRPERFIGTGAGLSPTINGHEYAYAPFSAGRHKCAGYGLAMLEIPVVAALAFRHYDMELLDPLPGMNYKEAFGVVGPDDKPARVRYQRRHHKN